MKKFIGEKLGQLAKSDFIKAFWMFLSATIVTAIGDAILQAMQSGTYSLESIHWKEIGAAILVSVVAYLQKQFASNSKGEVLKSEPKTEA